MADGDPKASKAEPSKEQLLAYVKKAKIKIKKLEAEVLELKSQKSQGKDAGAPPVVGGNEEEDVITSMWGGISSLATNIVTEVTAVVADEAGEGETTSSTGAGMAAAPSSSSISRDQDKAGDINKDLMTELKQVKELLREKSMQNEVLSGQVVKAETEVMGLQSKLSEEEKNFLGRISGLESEIASSNGRFAEDQKQLANLQDSIEYMHSDLSERKKEMEAAQQQSLELERAVKKAEGAAKEAESKVASERKSLEEKVDEQTKRAEKAEGEIMVLCEQQVAAENKMKALDTQLKELEKQTQASNFAKDEKEKEKKKKKGGKAVEEDAGVDSELVKDLTARLATAENEKQALQAAVDFNAEAEKADAKKLTQVEELNRKTMAKIKELKAENKQLKERAEALQNNVAQAQALHTEKASTAKEEGREKVEEDVKAALIKDHEQHLREKDGFITKAEEALREAKEALVAKEEERIAAVEEAAKHREEAEKYRGEAGERKKEIERRVEETRKHKAEADKHKKAAKEADKDAKKYQAESDRHRSETEVYKEQVSKHAGELSRLAAEREKEMGELVSQWEGQRDASVREYEAMLASLRGEVEALQKADAEQSAAVGELRRKLGIAENEATEAREERERQRRRVLELEGEAETHQTTAKESEADANALRDEHSALREQVEAVGASLQQAEERALKAEGATKDRDRQLDASKQRVDALSEKVTRLKTLLQRSKQLAQQKEQEVERLAQGGSRMKRFQILCQVEVQQTGDDGSSAVWCCALDHDHDESSHVRWVPQADTQAWLDEGSSVVGDTPELLQMQHARELKTVRVTLEKDRDSARSELKEVSEAFAAYKSRAQTALKRVGSEERKAKQHEGELQKAVAELATLSDRCEEAQREVEEARSEARAAHEAAKVAEEGLAALREGAGAEAAALKESLGAMEQERGAALASVKALESRLQGLEQALRDKEEQEISHLDQQQQQQQQPMTPTAAPKPTEPIPQPSSSSRGGPPEGVAGSEDRRADEDAQESSISLEATRKTAGSMRPAVSAADAIARNELELSRMLSEGTSPPSSGDKHPQQQTGQGGSGHEIGVYPFMSPQGTGMALAPSPTGDSKSVLQSVAEERAYAELVDMRRQNEILSGDLQDLQHKFGLTADQLSTLKGVIRELEATLEREREFNGSEGQAMNMEYLTNVLRKFLLSAVPSERSRLAMVLCQILKFSAAEVREITSIWEERKGLSGWFQRRSLAGVGSASAGGAMEAPSSTEISHLSK